MTKRSTLQFPKRFFWGVATSAHQVEGGTHNQWTEWELENAKSLAKQAEYKLDELPRWSAIKAEAMHPENYVSGIAVDHYHRYEADFDMVRDMNLNAFRFSIEWSRLEPEEGVWDPAAIEHYRQYLRALKARGLEPFVTLYHWTVPVWFAKKGGFEKASNVTYFVRFAEKVLHELGRDIRYITTINEPDTVVGHGYFTQDHPPQAHAPLKGLWVYRNLLSAHRRVYTMAKKMSRRYQVGFTKSYAHVYAGDSRRLTKAMVRLDYLVRDDMVLGYVGRKTDFIGVNYYFSDRYIGRHIVNQADKVNDLGWGMHPDHLEYVLRRLGRRRPKTPIFVTESGVADQGDRYRKWWIAHSVQAMQHALRDGVRVEGYLHWSFCDNFEWASGRWPRFGLVAIDYATLERTMRPSGVWYAALVKKARGL